MWKNPLLPDEAGQTGGMGELRLQPAREAKGGGRRRTEEEEEEAIEPAQGLSNLSNRPYNIWGEYTSV